MTNPSRHRIGRDAASNRPRYRCLTGIAVGVWLWCAGSAVALDVAAGGDLTQTGLPLIQTFTQEDYHAGRQNWNLVQNEQGVMYVANVDGAVLRFDGVRWRRIPVPDATTVRSLAIDGDGRVYVGTVGDFGYLAPDEVGRMQYVSLVDRIPPEHRNFADVWAILTTADAVYFSTFAGLYRLKDGSIRVWEPETSFHLSFEVDGRLFVRETDRGLQELVDGDLKLLPGGERFAEERVYVMLPWGDAPGQAGDALLIGTRSAGWFVYDGNAFRPWPTGVDAFLEQDLLYDAVRLDSGLLAVATLRGGVSLLDRHGRLLRRITRQEGLPDNAVFQLYEDRQAGLWLATNDGVVRLDMDAPVTRYDEHLGLQGAVLSVQRHDGGFYAGTTDGLYRMVPGADGAGRFEPVAAIRGQTWGLLSWDDALLVAGMQGVYELRDGAVRMIRPSSQTSFSLLRSSTDPNRIYVGMQNGLASLYFDDGRWIDEGRAPNVSDEIRTLFETAQHELWLGSWSRGAVRLPFEGTGPNALTWGEPERFGIAEDPAERGLIYVYALNGEVRFSSPRGLYRFDPGRGRLVPDPRFEGLFADGPRRAFPVHADDRGRVWMYTEHVERNLQETGGAVMGDDGGYHWDAVATAPLDTVTVQSIHAEDDGVVWFGTDNGLYRYDTTQPVARTGEYTALVTQVIGREAGGILFGGSDPAPVVDIEYANNALRFEYAAPSFDLLEANRYRVFLEGVDRQWSAWTAETYRDYTQIREGSYRFRVQAKNAYGVLSDEATYAFRILPPWYRTIWAYLFYLVAALGLIVGGFQWRSAALRRRNLALSRRVAARTRELSEANRALSAANQALAEQSLTDPLTGLRNRRYLVEQAPADVSLVDRHYRNRRGGRTGRSAENVDLLFLMVDIDNFKAVNDQYGHAAGDRVLEQMRDILLTVTRNSDTAVRWGGEEFLIVARFTDADFAPAMAERLRKTMAEHRFELGKGSHIHLTCSIGFAHYPLLPKLPDRIHWEEVVNVADECLYAAKRSGRDAWVGVRGGPEPPTDDMPDRVAQRLPRMIEAGYLEVMTAQRCGPLYWQAVQTR